MERVARYLIAGWVACFLAAVIGALAANAAALLDERSMTSVYAGCSTGHCETVDCLGNVPCKQDPTGSCSAGDPNRACDNLGQSKETVNNCNRQSGTGCTVGDPVECGSYFSCSCVLQRCTQSVTGHSWYTSGCTQP